MIAVLIIMYSEFCSMWGIVGNKLHIGMVKNVHRWFIIFCYLHVIRKLEENWKIIRDEGLSALKAQTGFEDEAESLRDTGSWKQFELFARGQ